MIYFFALPLILIRDSLKKTISANKAAKIKIISIDRPQKNQHENTILHEDNICLFQKKKVFLRKF